MSQHNAGLGRDGASDNVFSQPQPISRLDEHLAQVFKAEIDRFAVELAGLRERTSTAPGNVFRAPFVPLRPPPVEPTVYVAFMELPSHASSTLRASMRNQGIALPHSGDVCIGPRDTGTILGFRGAQTFLLQGTLRIAVPRHAVPPVLNRRCPYTGVVSGDGTYRSPTAYFAYEGADQFFFRSAEYAIIHSESPPPWRYVFEHCVPEDSGLGVRMRSIGREAGSWYIVPRSEMV